MALRTPLGPTLLGLGLMTMALAGCGHYVNPDITDPAQARRQLADDTTLCRALANQAVPPTYGLERQEADPTIEAQADRYVANVEEDDAHQDAFSRCLRDRGWIWKK